MPAYTPRPYIPKPITTLKASDVLVEDAAEVFTSSDVEGVLAELYEQIYALPIIPKHVFVLKCTEENVALTVSSAIYVLRMPVVFHHIQSIRASLAVEQASGTIIIIDIKRNGNSIFSVPLTINNGEKSSLSATPYIAYDDYWEDDDEIVVDIMQIGDGTAKGLKLYFVGLEEENPEVDPLWANVVALLHMEGVAGATNVVDSAAIPATITTSGAAPYFTNTREVGASSLQSSGAYTAPVPGNLILDNTGAYNFGTGDLSIEFWYARTVTGTTPGLLGFVNDLTTPPAAANRGLNLWVQKSNAGWYISYYSGASEYISPPAVHAIPVGAAIHVELTRKDGVFYLFLDGTIALTWASALSINNTRYMVVFGTYVADSKRSYGRMDELRVTKGAARHTSDFTPSVIPFAEHT